MKVRAKNTFKSLYLQNQRQIPYTCTFPLKFITNPTFYVSLPPLKPTISLQRNFFI